MDIPKEFKTTSIKDVLTESKINNILIYARTHKNCKDWKVYESCKQMANSLNLTIKDYEVLICKITLILGL